MTGTSRVHLTPAFVVVRDIAVSWAYYIEAAPVSPLPPHLLLHLAGATPEGVRVIELWDSRPAWENFAGTPDDRLVALERTVPARASVIRTLDVSHVLEVATGEVGSGKGDARP